MADDERIENVQAARILRNVVESLDRGDIIAGRVEIESDLDDLSSDLETVHAWRDSGRRTMTFYYWQCRKEE